MRHRVHRSGAGLSGETEAQASQLPIASLLRLVDHGYLHASFVMRPAITPCSHLYGDAGVSYLVAPIPVDPVKPRKKRDSPKQETGEGLEQAERDDKDGRAILGPNLLDLVLDMVRRRGARWRVGSVGGLFDRGSGCSATGCGRAGESGRLGRGK